MTTRDELKAGLVAALAGILEEDRREVANLTRQLKEVKVELSRKDMQIEALESRVKELEKK